MFRIDRCFVYSGIINKIVYIGTLFKVQFIEESGLFRVQFIEESGLFRVQFIEESGLFRVLFRQVLL
jgi:hypothetical protein